MKILITGPNGYLSRKVEAWLSNWHDKFNIAFISLKDDCWKNFDFSGVDVVLHFAALVHDQGARSSNEEFVKINQDLAVDLAKKAKKENVKHFIFMSTMAVYGFEGLVNEKQTITRDTPCKPVTIYGSTKLIAEQRIQEIESEDFIVSIIRAPMIYGPGCPGNYAMLRKLINKFRVFPYLSNERSMLFITNFTEFVHLLILEPKSGIFYPQNREYVNVYEMAKLICKCNNRTLHTARFLGRIMKSISSIANISMLNKVFGSLSYEKELSSHFDWKYCICSFNESIKITETYWNNDDISYMTSTLSDDKV